MTEMTMAQFLKVARCTRCNKRMDKRPDWNFETKDGAIVAVLCPDCQTVEENAEAEINAATLEYKRDAFGRIIARPKVGA